MAVVEFDMDGFREQYPQFSGQADAQLRAAFKMACMLLDNTEASVVPYAPEKGIYDREVLLFLLVCHLSTQANLTTEGQSGPVSSASEGSVSVSFEVPKITDKTYFLQTPCGRTFWQLTAKYRGGPGYLAIKHIHPWG